MKGSKDCYVLSIDIGGSKLITGIVSSQGKVVHKVRTDLNPMITAEQIINIILKNASDLKKQYEELNIVSVGIAIPGLADSDKGIWVYSCFSGIKNLDIAGMLSAKLQLPVFIENDVNVCAFGEKVYGNCRDTKNFLWVTVSNGVGGGVILNGKIFTGSFKNAGEVGHINVAEDGYRCPCGNYGCLEAYASGLAIARRYYEGAAATSVQVAPDMDARHIAALARKGDSLAIKTYNDTGYYLGKAIASVVNVINPEKVILGGGVSLDIELFIDSMRTTADRMIFKEANKCLVIGQTALLYDAALIGAAAVAQERMECI